MNEPTAKIEKFTTGFTRLDRMMNGGFEAGRLMILAAEEKLGKTTLAENLSYLSAKLNKIRVHYYMLVEMSEWEMMSRFYAMDSGVAQSNIYNQWIIRDSEDLEAVSRSANLFKQWSEENRLKVFCNPSLSSLDAIRKNSRKHGGADLTVIDQGNKVSGYPKDEEYLRGSKLARDAKVFASEERTQLIWLSQINRPTTVRDNPKPTKHRIFGSSGLSQECDCLLFIHNPHANKNQLALSTEEKMERHLIIDEIRNGQTGTVKVRFRGEISRFEEKSQQDEPTSRKRQKPFTEPEPDEPEEDGMPF